MLEFLNTHLYGLADLSFWGYVGVTLLWMHTTMMAITSGVGAHFDYKG